jgi:hypothetical protein
MIRFTSFCVREFEFGICMMGVFGFRKMVEPPRLPCGKIWIPSERSSSVLQNQKFGFVKLK